MLESGQRTAETDKRRERNGKLTRAITVAREPISTQGDSEADTRIQKNVVPCSYNLI